MKLDGLEFIRLLPQFMRDDTAVKGLAAGIDQVVPDLSASLSTLSTWDKIDELSEEELDALAWELNIVWYDNSAPLGIKRELVKNSDQVYSHLGTKWAVESVIKTYFGEGYVEEWFEYGGEPGYFRIYSSNPSITSDKVDAFLHILEKVKRASAKLDGIFITLTGQMILTAGVAVHEVSAEQYGIGDKLA